jgi:hypothetical protein
MAKTRPRSALRTRSTRTNRANVPCRPARECGSERGRRPSQLPRKGPVVTPGATDSAGDGGPRGDAWTDERRHRLRIVPSARTDTTYFCYTRSGMDSCVTICFHGGLMETGNEGQLRRSEAQSKTCKCSKIGSFFYRNSTSI